MPSVSFCRLIGSTTPSQFRLDFFGCDASNESASTFENLCMLDYDETSRVSATPRLPFAISKLWLSGWYQAATVAIFGAETSDIAAVNTIHERRSKGIRISETAFVFPNMHNQNMQQQQSSGERGNQPAPSNQFNAERQQMGGGNFSPGIHPPPLHNMPPFRGGPVDEHNRSAAFHEPASRDHYQNSFNKGGEYDRDQKPNINQQAPPQDSGNFHHDKFLPNKHRGPLLPSPPDDKLLVPPPHKLHHHNGNQYGTFERSGYHGYNKRNDDHHSGGGKDNDHIKDRRRTYSRDYENKTNKGPPDQVHTLWYFFVVFLYVHIYVL